MNATRTGRLHLSQSLPFFLMHLGVLAVFFVPFSWKLVALCVIYYYVGMFFVTGGYHRYFSHRTYKLGRVAQFLMAWGASSTMQKGVLWWAGNHRHHHRFSDQPQDLHSPIQKGFWYSHWGWILIDTNEETLWDQIQDLAKFPELRWLNKYHLVPAILNAAIVLALFGLPGFVWIWVVGSVMLWHGTFTINSLSHVYGSQRYASNDTSRNNFWLALITLGEGWHNNHHAYQSSVRQGFRWWEIDATFYVLKALSWARVVWDLKTPPAAVRLNEYRLGSR
ncbi:MAG: acyl-CoA desaturase, partial [Bdellovibrionota bacterium]